MNLLKIVSKFANSYQRIALYQTMLHRIAQYISRHALLCDGARVIVALSGGADSVALLHILRRLRYDCIAVHCNFHLRGEESIRDQHFVEELCRNLDTPLQIVEFDTKGYAQENRISIEMAARELRYTAFEKIRNKQAARAIAVAHHRDDSAETLLLNLIRGCGIHGLHGIQPKNGCIIRPLLCIGRNDILQYLHNEGQDYVTDSSNLSSDYTRNKIRLEILPLMAKINPSIGESIAETAMRIAEAEKIYNQAIVQATERVLSDNVIDISRLRQEAAPQTLLHEILSPYGFNSTQINDIIENIDSNSGRRYIGSDKEVIKDRDKLLIVSPTKRFDKAVTLPHDGTIETPYGLLKISSAKFDGNIPKQRNIATLDANKIEQPLILRTTKSGDRFHPFGMRGTKLVSDYLTDRKRSIIEKEQQLVVTDANDKILWLVNERPSALCSIGKETSEVITIEWIQ